MLGNRVGERSSYTGARLPGAGVANSLQCRGAAPPEITVERGPQAWLLEGVTPVALKAAYRSLGLRLWERHIDVSLIGGVEPHSDIGIQYPIPPAS